ncbi:type VII secretion protein EccE [Mycobacterium sp. TY814]|uniref:type VII secretion protein EccE n=1 Tax=unclassified Mycobacterium TaxID=2642494 RepID=UPI00274077CE|nr:type VII secretion protein EccE [Mycobacterium sp. TY814]MDP7722809.1 type VII secretion protein EccE [Mycobacterium sp. TY814]
MSHSIPAPGAARVTLALLAVVPAAMAYPWQSTRAYWLIGIAAVAVILLFGWWRGLHFTTILRRRLAIVRRGGRPVPEPDANTRTTALLRLGPASSAALPLPLIARYLNCYGIRADSIRITSRHNASGATDTWIGLTVSAVDNLAALQARSARIPLHETAEVAARRLADHLREVGFDANTVAAEDVPEVLAFESGETARETWSAVQLSGSDYVAAYRVKADDGLGVTLAAVREQQARETWTALEIADAGTHRTVAAACALRTDAAPGGTAPVAGLTLERGNQRPALQTLDPLSTRRLDGHTEAPADLLERLDWPTAQGPSEALSRI